MAASLLYHGVSSMLDNEKSCCGIRSLPWCDFDMSKPSRQPVGVLMSAFHEIICVLVVGQWWHENAL